MGGRSIGPPDPIGQDTFEGFDTKVMEMKTVATQDGNLGKIRTFSCCSVTGNKNGLVGVGLGKSGDGKAAMKRSKNRAGQKLVYIQRYNNHTVMHDFFSQFGQTKIFVYKKHEGFGLVCHRAIRTMCELIGIKDIYAKVEGSMNMQHLIKAFMLGLLKQKSHDELAKMKQLFLVEQREENGMFPTVVGMPEVCRKPEEIKPEEILDFSMAGFDERLPLRRKLYQPFFTKLPGWQYHLLKTEFKRNHQKTRVQLLAQYGGTRQHARSHLTKDFPEADGFYPALLHRKAIAARQESD
jgi:small subunit ribosomal protein S5